MTKQQFIKFKYFSGCEREFDFLNVDHENTTYHSQEFQTFENIFLGTTTIVIFTTNILLIMTLVSSKYLR